MYTVIRSPVRQRRHCPGQPATKPDGVHTCPETSERKPVQKMVDDHSFIGCISRRASGGGGDAPSGAAAFAILLLRRRPGSVPRALGSWHTIAPIIFRFPACMHTRTSPSCHPLLFSLLPCFKLSYIFPFYFDVFYVNVFSKKNSPFTGETILQLYYIPCTNQ